MDQSRISKIDWPPGLSATPEMHYESLAPLYQTTPPNSDEEHLSFAVQCSINWNHISDLRGCVHKVDVITKRSLADAKLAVTHEVLPNQGAGSHVIVVNDKLRVAGFDSGSIVPIRNFGPKKTFNCDVRGRLEHHSGGIIHLSADPAGKRLVSCSTDGTVALYEVNEEDISLVSKARVDSHEIAAVEFLNPIDDFNPMFNDDDDDESVIDSNNLILYATHHGHIGIIDARCGLRDALEFRHVHSTKPLLDITTMCVLKDGPGIQAYFGSRSGRIVNIDMRYDQDYLNDKKLPGDGSIRRMKEVLVPGGGNETKQFIAYTNDTPILKIVEPIDLHPAEGFKCDRSMLDNKCMDVVQVGNRLITCGAQTSIGCWVWEDSPLVALAD